MGCKLVAYLRVSTQKQGQSGLGLEAQQAAIDAYAKATGCTIVATYTEVETGKRADRPELLRAISHAKRSRSTLVIAKLDRLSRKLHFISGLMEEGVDFVACDKPGKDRLMLHLNAMWAEEEARRISERTKSALAALKARGGLLGASRPESRNLNDDHRREGARRAGNAHKKRADDAYSDLADLVGELRADGLSQSEIAKRLNEEGHTTRTGKPWNQVQVGRVLKRFGIG